MDYTTEKVFLLILILEAITGLFYSFSVIACLLIKQFRRNNLTTYSKILIPLSVSNICYISMFSINFSLTVFRVELLFKDFLYYTTMYFTLYSSTSSLWLSGGLCVFYFIKIMPSQPGVLTRLKSQIGAVVWWLVIVAEVVSLGGSFLSLLIPNAQKNQINSTFQSVLMEEVYVPSVMFTNTMLILNILPFLVIMMTTIGSTWFLKLYNCQIQKNLATSGNTSVRDFQSAIQTMIGLLVLYSSVFVCVIIFALNILPYRSLVYWICVIFLFSFPTVLSAMLIYRNPKLKEYFKHMFILYITPQDSS